MKRAFIMVLDSFGIGATEDAERFGDVGSDTLGHIAEACAKGEADNGRKGPLNLPNLTRLGLVKAHEGSTGKIAAGMDGNAEVVGAYAWAHELSSGKEAGEARQPAGLPRQLPLFRYRDSGSARRRAYENRQADFLYLC